MKMGCMPLLFATLLALCSPVKSGEMNLIENETVYKTVISPLKEDNKKAWRYAPALISNYPEQKNNSTPYEGYSFSETLLDKYSERISDNPMYHVITPYKEGDLPYEEAAWDALGYALKTHIPIIKKAEEEVYKIRESMTVKYKRGDLSLKLRPYIQGTSSKECGVNIISNYRDISMGARFNDRRQMFSIQNRGEGIKIKLSLGYDSRENETTAFISLNR